MDKEKDIEDMAKTLCKCHFATCADCMRQSSTTAYRCDFIERAKILSAASYGNVKEAVKKFAETVEEIIERQVPDLAEDEEQLYKLKIAEGVGRAEAKSQCLAIIREQKLLYCNEKTCSIKN